MTFDRSIIRVATWLSSMSDEQWSAFVRRLAKGLFVASILFVGLQVAGANFWKSSLVAALAFLMHRIGIGAGRIEQLTAVVFALIAIEWLDLLPLRRWIAGAMIAIDRTLT
jgi:hypothetical protein